MPKRLHAEDEEAAPLAKRQRGDCTDRISKLSDELLLRILSYVSVSDLLICQRLSRRWNQIAGDSQLWKAAYYNRFVRPRASRLPGIKGDSNHLHFSSKVSKWLDEENLVRRGRETNWKRQYRIRHNWARGSCDVSEIRVSERPPVPPLLVRLHEGILFTADSIAGLRAWSSKTRMLLAGLGFQELLKGRTALPTSLAVDTEGTSLASLRIVIGFDDGRFSICELRDRAHLVELYTHPASSNGMLTATSFASPYVLTMTATQLLSLYQLPHCFGSRTGSATPVEPPRLLCSLKSHTVHSPMSLTLRITPLQILASIAYALPTYLAGWSVGIQEMRFSRDGDLLDSRLASSHGQYRSLSPGTARDGCANLSSDTGAQGLFFSKPTSLSYSHPYLLLAHPDNTLTLYLVTSTAATLSISPGSRLWGHTSSVSDAQVGGRGKAVSVSSRGDELRIWELEGGMASSITRKRLATGELSVRIKPEPKPYRKSLDLLSDAITQRGSGLGLALEYKLEDMSVTRGWVGFDEENVIVLRERSQGGQSLVVYDFS